MQILTIFDKDYGFILSQQALEIPVTEEGLKEAKIIAEKLQQTLTPLMPAAGLAAPQIGISKRLFIYSWDRTLENITIVINPKIIQSSDDTTTSWEACFSTIQHKRTSLAAFITRANSLTVEYLTPEGKTVQAQLNGFAAKVFQHEYEHLEGMTNIRKKDAEIKEFPTKNKLVDFMSTVKMDDRLSYVEPIINFID